MTQPPLETEGNELAATAVRGGERIEIESSSLQAGISTPSSAGFRELVPEGCTRSLLRDVYCPVLILNFDSSSPQVQFSAVLVPETTFTQPRLVPHVKQAGAVT